MKGREAIAAKLAGAKRNIILSSKPTAGAATFFIAFNNYTRGIK